jgi:antitoxin component of RelBE/YafQ-DinJ toxin-antitoxin module
MKGTLPLTLTPPNPNKSILSEIKFEEKIKKLSASRTTILF